MTVLVRAMHFSGVYDNLNGPSLASIEELCLRLSQLIEAYSAGEAGRPSWHSVKHFTSSASSNNIVPTTLRTYALRKTKEEVELENLRLRASGRAVADLDDERPPLAPTGKPQAAPKGKAARAAGKSGKGGATPDAGGGGK